MNIGEICWGLFDVKAFLDFVVDLEVFFYANSKPLFISAVR